MLQKIIDKVKTLLNGGFFHIFVGNTLIKMIAFVSSVVVVRLVNKNDYAYLTYADNLYNYVISFAGLGMSSAILKYCATAKSQEEDKAYFMFALKYGTLFEAVLSLVVVLYVTFAAIPFPETKVIVYILVLYPALNNIINTILNYLRAHGENKMYANAAVLQTGIVFIFSVVLVLVIGINGIALARYLAIAVAIFCTIKILKKNMKYISASKLDRSQVKAFMGMSISLTISNIFSLIMPINEMTLVNSLLHNEVITANYKIAIMIPSQLTFITQSIVVYYFTVVAKMENRREVWKLTKKVGLVSAALIFVVCAFGALLSPYIIRIVYGSRYEDAIGLSMVFWGVYSLNAAVRMVPMNFLPAIGETKFNAIMAIVSCVIHLVFTYIGIVKFGIWGAGISTAIVYVLSGIGYWICFRKKCLKHG